MNDKTVALALLAMVALIAVVGLLLLFSGATGQVYGGALKGAEYPYVEGRSAKGVPFTPEGIKVVDEQTASAEAVPYRTYGRTPEHIPTVLTSCGEGYIGADVALYSVLVDTYRSSCSDFNRELGVWCCKIPTLASSNS